MLLEGKRILVSGVLTKESIAFAIVQALQREGATVVLTSFARVRRMTQRASARFDGDCPILEFDALDPDAAASLERQLAELGGVLHGVVHAIAYAPPGAIGGGFLDASADDAGIAFRASAHSYAALVRAALPQLRAGGGGGVVGLDFDGQRAWPAYDWMGVAKAGLEAVNRYLARDLGPEGIRANLVSAGPVRTLAASGIEGFDALAGLWPRMAPLGWDIRDPAPIADAVCLLLSDLARGITGGITFVDGGVNAATVIPAVLAESSR